jgi:hypothetical protein
MEKKSGYQPSQEDQTFRIGDLTKGSRVEIFTRGSERSGSFIARIKKILRGGDGQINNYDVVAEIIEDHPAGPARIIHLGRGTAARQCKNQSRESS